MRKTKNNIADNKSQVSRKNILKWSVFSAQFMGGQAIIEGVMLRGPSKWAAVCKAPSGEIRTQVNDLEIKKTFYRRVPVMRGFIALVESMRIGYKALMWSSDIAMEEEDDEKLESSVVEEESKWVKIGNALMITFSIVLFLGLFTVIPVWVSNLIKNWLGLSSLGFHIIEIVMRMVMFMGYIILIGLAKDIKRIFQYHGAEHKSIAAYENGVVLKPEVAQQFTTAHVRCGTNFLLIVMLFSQVVYSIVGVFFKDMNFFSLLLSRLILVPVIAGISYELLKIAAQHMDKVIVRKIMWAGLKLQSLTTREPDNEQVGIAILSLKAAMTDEQIEEVSHRELVEVANNWQKVAT
mgnify:FL=1